MQERLEYPVFYFLGIHLFVSLCLGKGSKQLMIVFKGPGFHLACSERSKSEAGMNLGTEVSHCSRLLDLDVRRCHLSGKQTVFQ